jgi:TPR repeat protein
MRRIAATLVVVGALLFSAGSSWADFDDGMAAYERGDYATALKEFRPLAEQGHVVAQFNLGVMYDHGYGVPENNTEAVKWFRKAAVQGNSKAQSQLGIMYVLGIGVPKDYVKAHMWFSLAKAEGHEGAAKSLDMVKEEMNTTQIDEAQKLAAEMWEKINN